MLPAYEKRLVFVPLSTQRHPPLQHSPLNWLTLSSLQVSAQAAHDNNKYDD